MTIPYISHSQHIVLVVDDDAQVVRTLRDILTRDGFEVLTAQDAAQAFELLEQSLPCMILLDVEMPGMSGFEMCRRLKQAPRTAHLPVALVTARVQDADVKEGIAAGAVDYIKKPFDTDEVRMRVRTQIRLHEAILQQQQLHQHLAVISAAAKDAIITISNQGKILHWNEAAERIFGYARDEALGQDLHRLFSPLDFHQAQGKAFPRFQATGDGAAMGKTLELTALRKSGEEFPVELSLAAARISDEWCAVGIVRDITERKLTELAQQKSYRRARAQLALFQRQLASEADVSVYAVEQLAQLTDSAIGFIGIVNPREDTLSAYIWPYQARRDSAGESKPVEFDLRDAGPWADAVKERRTIFLEGYVAANPLKQNCFIDQVGPSRLLVIPLVRLGRTVLVAGLGNKAVSYVESDVVEANLFMEGVWGLICRIREERGRRESESRVRALFDSSPDALFIAGPDGRFLEANPVAVSQYGYSRDELMAQTLPGLAAASMREEASALLEQARNRAVQIECLHRRKDGSEFPVDIKARTLTMDGQVCVLIGIRDITERKRVEEALRESEEKLQRIISSIDDILYSVDGQTEEFVFLSPAFERVLGYTSGDIERMGGRKAFLSQVIQEDMFREQHRVLLEHRARKKTETLPWQAWWRCKNGDLLCLEDRYIPLYDGDRLLGTQGVLRDVTAGKQIEAELAHARKLEAVGQLAAGIAHEINTPAQYIGDSVHFLQESFGDYRRLAGRYRQVIDALEKAGEQEALVRKIRETEQEVDLPYIEANVPGSFDRCLDGIARISTIVGAMKEFAHPDQREQSSADMNQALQSTVIIARNEYKYVADLETELGELPPVLCHIGDLNQVFLNLIVNASHAIADVVGQSGAKGRIRIRTRREGDFVRIDFTDTGSGIPEKIRHRIFEPLRVRSTVF